MSQLDIKAAVFDMDGLLLDSERVLMEACIAAARDIGITYTLEQYTQLIGNAWGTSTKLMIAQLGSEENFKLLMAGLDKHLAVHEHHFPLKPGALDLLQYYQANGVICAVASSSPLEHINTRLAKVGVRDYFSAVASGHEVTNGKPAPDVYLLAMERLREFGDFEVGECIAFEDSNPGATAAMAAGLRTIVVPDLKQPSEDVRNRCNQVVESLTAFLADIAQ